MWAPSPPFPTRWTRGGASASTSLGTRRGPSAASTSPPQTSSSASSRFTSRSRLRPETPIRLAPSCSGSSSGCFAYRRPTAVGSRWRARWFVMQTRDVLGTSRTAPRRWCEIHSESRRGRCAARLQTSTSSCGGSSWGSSGGRSPDELPRAQLSRAENATRCTVQSPLARTVPRTRSRSRTSPRTAILTVPPSARRASLKWRVVTGIRWSTTARDRHRSGSVKNAIARPEALVMNPPLGSTA